VVLDLTLPDSHGVETFDKIFQAAPGVPVFDPEQEITADPGDATIVSAMINIGRSLRQRVIAEGVETRAQLKFLQHHGCAEGQGYYFSRPVVAEQAGNLFKVGIREGMVH
jgi:hypothetical protein